MAFQFHRCRLSSTYLYQSSETGLGISVASIVAMQTFGISHIENRRLFDAAAGTAQLDERERHHLHECEVCQSVFHVFINQPLIKTKTNDPAA